MDEREGLPSVSKFGDYEECNLRYQLEMLAPQPDRGKWSQFGESVHAITSGLDQRAKVTDEEIAAAKEMKELEDLEVEFMRSSYGISWDAQEQRLWYRRNGSKVFSGKPDRYLILDDPLKTGIIVERKSLWGNVAPATHNWQVAGQALLLRQNFGCKRVLAQVNQPKRAQRHEPAQFDENQLIQAEMRVLGLIDKITAPDAKANPGPAQCANCAAKLICKSAYNNVETVAASRKAEIITMDDRTLEKLVVAAKAAKKIGEAADTELWKRYHDRPTEFPDWFLSPNGDTAKIHSAAMAYQLLGVDIGPEAFTECCEVSFSQLSAKVAHKYSLEDKDARAYVKKALSASPGLLEIKPKKMTLERKPNWERES